MRQQTLHPCQCLFVYMDCHYRSKRVSRNQTCCLSRTFLVETTHNRALCQLRVPCLIRFFQQNYKLTPIDVTQSKTYEVNHENSQLFANINDKLLDLNNMEKQNWQLVLARIDVHVLSWLTDPSWIAIQPGNCGKSPHIIKQVSDYISYARIVDLKAYLSSLKMNLINTI